MKLILLACAIVANGESFTEDSLRISLEDMQESLKNIKQQLIDIQKETLLIFVQKLEDNPKVNKMKDTINNFLESSNGKATEKELDSTTSMESTFMQLITGLYQKLLTEIAENITGTSFFIRTVIEEVETQQLEIEENFEDNVKLCMNDDIKCVFSKENIEKMDQLLQFVDLVATHIRNAIQISPYFQSEELNQIIVEEFKSPVYQCLKEN